MLKLGDVIYFESYCFVYLAQKNDNYTYYFAKIISDPEIIRECLIKKEAARRYRYLLGAFTSYISGQAACFFNTHL